MRNIQVSDDAENCDYGLEHKKQYYRSRVDGESGGPDGAKLRADTC